MRLQRKSPQRFQFPELFLSGPEHGVHFLGRRLAARSGELSMGASEQI